MAQDYFINESIFLEDVYMRKNLTVTGILSALNFSFPGLDALSGNWQNTYLTVSALSASWGTDNAYDLAVRALTANWQNTYTTVSSYSASWGVDNTNGKYLPLSGGIVTGPVKLLSSFEIGSGYTILYISDTAVGIGTETPNETLTVVGNISASGSYFGDGSNLTGLVGDNNYYVYNPNNGEYKLAAAYAEALVDSTSDKVYFQVYDTTLILDGVSYEITDNMPSTLRRAISAAAASSYDTSNWQNTYTTVSTYSASWSNAGNSVDTGIRAISANWQNTYTTVSSFSGDWGVFQKGAGTNSIQPSNSFNQAISNYSSIIGGKHAVTSHEGEIAFTNSRFNNLSGSFQKSFFTLSTTTDSSNKYKNLALDGATSYFVIPNNTIYYFNVNVSCLNTVTNFCNVYYIKGFVKNISNTLTLSPFTIKEQVEEDSNLKADVFINNTNKTLSIQVTGSNDITYWGGSLDTIKIKF